MTLAGEVLSWTPMLLGPCMVAAPAVAVAGLLLLPLWPVAIVVMAVVRLVSFPVAWVATRAGLSWGEGLRRRMKAAWQLVLKPWTYFTPQGDASAAAPEE